MAKLTRAQIKEGLKSVPMSKILIGAQGTVPNLTHKQIAFAKQVALGKSTQADAYRDVYKSKGNPKTVGSHASRLATDDRIATAIDSFKAAQAYAEYQTPVQLRALVVSQLTKHVLDCDFPPAQRVACLKLLGSVAEIGLFVDRKETLVIHKSGDVKARLLDQLRTLTGQVTDVTPSDDANSLLDELNSGKLPVARPTVPAPPVVGVVDGLEYIHSIPLEIPVENSIPLEITNPESIPTEISSPESIFENKNLNESGELSPSVESGENVSR